MAGMEKNRGFVDSFWTFSKGGIEPGSMFVFEGVEIFFCQNFCHVVAVIIHALAEGWHLLCNVAAIRSCPARDTRNEQVPSGFFGMILRCDRKFDVNFTPSPMSMYTFILLIPEVFFCARNFRDFLFTSKHGRPMVLCTLNQEKPVNPLARFRVGDRVTARVPMKISHEGRGYFNEVCARWKSPLKIFRVWEAEAVVISDFRRKLTGPDPPL